MTSDELKARAARARDAYNSALDMEASSKRLTQAAWDNYERCQDTYEEALLEEQA